MKLTPACFVFLAFFCFAYTADMPYKDGHYKGCSRGGFTNEPYYGFTEIEIKDGRIVQVNYYIRDSSKHEVFNAAYERYFKGNELYVQQCRNDWQGIQSYPDSLVKYQDIKKVDAISGATWSYKIFKASVKDALRSATKE